MHRGPAMLSAILCGLLVIEQANALTKEQLDKTANGIRNSCVTKSGADPALAAGVRGGTISDDHGVQCYIHCALKSMRAFKNGKVDVDMVVKQVDMMMPADIKEGMKEAAIACKETEVSSDECVTAYNYVKCNYEAKPDLFFFP